MSYLSIGLLVCLMTLVAHWVLAARRPENANPSRAGGIIVAAAALGLGFLATRLPIGAAHLSATGLTPVLAGAGLIALIGWLDDHHPLPPLLKLAGQVAAAAITYGLGLSAGFLPPGLINAALVIFCLVGGANALNLVDGVDGLAGAVSLIAAATIFAVARNAGNIEGAVMAAALAGGMLAFLWQNLPPARVYLGDAGSNFVGFTLAALPLLLSSGPRGFEHFSAAMLLLAVPIVETATSIGRRLAAGRSPLQRDRQHIHHRLLRQGWTIGAVVGLGTGITAALGALVLLGRDVLEGPASDLRTLINWSLLLVLLVVSSLYVGWHAGRLASSSKR
ncbi:MAG TPA: MraY family glycosyltransferase [Candidatus Eisenbacteria bacterium]